MEQTSASGVSTASATAARAASGAASGIRRRGLAAPLALPAGFAALLVVGAIAAGTDGGLSALWVLGLAAAIVLAGSAVSEPAVAPVLGVIGWLTVTGFSHAPYAQLRVTGPLAPTAALVIAACTLTGVVAGLVLRRAASSFTLFVVNVSGPPPDEDPVTGLPMDWSWPEPALPQPALSEPALSEPALSGPARSESVPPVLSEATPPETANHEPVPSEPAQAAGNPPLPVGLGAFFRRLRFPDLTGGIGRKRLACGIVLLVAGLPLLTLVLSAAQMRHLSDDLLVYLVVVVAVAVVGGFWPAVIAAIAASLLVNWYFTPPVHTLTIGDGQSLLSLLLFITVAVTVSSVVHLAAHRARQAARAAGEAQELLALAQTVLGGADAPAAVLAHLTGGYGGRAELLEKSGGQWVRVAASGELPAAPDGVPARPEVRAAARDDLVLVAGGQDRPLADRLLHGFAAQAASALDRDRLRTQAAQAEVLAEGNRMRTALLAAVSHDLRTPLASIKASVSSLRQTDVTWSEDDEAELLATIERSSDRLDALIGNLLDMSRLTTGSLEPFLRPTAIDEVAPVALRGLDEGGRLRLMVPDDLPLVRTDPGLLERVLANLFANALTYSPPRTRPELRARPDGGGVLLDIVDHGRGAPDELKQQMFEPFERLDVRGGGAPGGIGLGLAVVRGFLDLMGGSVEALDTPGGGLTMRVRLPAAVEAAAGSAAEESAGASPAPPRPAQP